MSGPIDIYADLSITQDGQEIRLKGAGSKLFLQFPNSRSLISTLGAVSQQSAFLKLNQSLSKSGVRVYLAMGRLNIPLTMAVQRLGIWCARLWLRLYKGQSKVQA